MASIHLVKNSIVGIIQLLLTAILTLISVPIFVHNLGMELYGIFAIISVIGNLNLLANFGLNGALLVYIAKQGKCRQSDHDIVVTLTIMILLTSVFTFFAFLFSDFIVRELFSIPTIYIHDAKILLHFLVFANSFLLIGQTFTATIDAVQKIHITNICQFIYSLIYWGGLIIAVSLGGQLNMIGIIAVLSAIIWCMLVMYFSHRVWGKLDLREVLINFKSTAKKQLIYGSKIYLSGLAGFMFEPLSKILLSNFVGINAVALFEIGLKIRSQLNGLMSKALYPIYPYIANTTQSDILHKKLIDFSKKIQLIVIPMTIITIFITTIVLKLWLGSANLVETSIFVITMSSTMLLLAPPVLLIYQYLAAKNMADKNIWVQTTSVIVNIVVFFTLFNKMGAYAILFSNTLALVSSYILCNYYQYKYLGMKFKEEFPYYLKLLLFGITCTFLCLFVRHFIPIGIWDLIIYPFVVGFSFITFVRKQELINISDLELYFGYMPYLKNKLKRIFIND